MSKPKASKNKRPLLAELRSQALLMNQRAVQAAVNTYDWVLRPKQLVKSGLTEYETVYAGDLMKVRYYSLVDEDEIELEDGSRMPVRRRQHSVPLVLVPPLGVTVETFDLLPQRSLVRYLAARGFKTYLIDWGEPQRRHAHLGLFDYADEMFTTALDEVRKHSGKTDLSLMGWCMGGLLSLIHLGLQQDPRIRNLITVASPINLRGGGIVAGAAQAINAPAQIVRRYSDFRLENLDPSKLQLPAWATTVIFKLTDPIGSVTTYWDLLMRSWDREFVVAHSTTANYLNNMLMYPAGMLRDFAIKVAVDNDLASGRIVVGERVAELGNIQSSLLAFAGAGDVLVKPPIAEKIMDVVGVDVGNHDKAFHIAPGGHMGVILGKSALESVWAPAADWLVSRSKQRPYQSPNRG